MDHVCSTTATTGLPLNKDATAGQGRVSSDDTALDDWLTVASTTRSLSKSRLPALAGIHQPRAPAANMTPTCPDQARPTPHLRKKEGTLVTTGTFICKGERRGSSCLVHTAATICNALGAPLAQATRALCLLPGQRLRCIELPCTWPPGAAPPRPALHPPRRHLAHGDQLGLGIKHHGQRAARLEHIAGAERDGLQGTAAGEGARDSLPGASWGR